MNSKNFFVTNFLNFIEKEKSFFKKNKTKFIVSLSELIKKSYPQIEIQKEIINRFYESLFIEPYLNKGNLSYVTEFLNYLQEKHINIEILNKTFLFLVNQYIKYIFPTSNIENLKTFVLLLDFYAENLKNRVEITNIDNSLPKEIYKIFKNRQTIYVFGVYKGIPISHPSKILAISKKEKSIKVNANNYQIIASKFQKEIYILEPKTNLTLKALVIDTDPVKKILTLVNLEKVKRSMAKRNYLRVQPKEEIKAYIINKEVYEGIIYDISIKGISILSKKLPLEINQFINVKFTLPIKKELYEFYIMAQLRSISSYNEKIRYHFYFEPNKKEEILLEKYIKAREKEIIRELMFYLKNTFIDV